MKNAKLELTVGLFMLIGILCLGYLSIKLGKMELTGGNTYRVTARFDSVSGLKNGARVELAGVEVGTVERIGLSPPTVNAALADMERLGIVTEVTGKKRNRVFSYRAYLDILSEGTAPL